MELTVAKAVGSCSPPGDLGEEYDVGEWMSVAEAAELLEVDRRTVQRSLAEDERRAREWGAEGEGWRYKPLADRKIYQLRRNVVLRKAGRDE
jgi:excisionase family DNA binding protein